MGIPVYTTDLVDIDLCEAGGKTWAEPTAANWTLGAAPAALNDDDAIQGLLSVSKAFNASGVGGMMVNNTSGITLPTDGAILGWFMWACPGSLAPDAEGGIRMMVGADLANFLSWDVGGNTSYVYGGWVNFAVNTTVTPDDTVGTGLGNSQYFGTAVYNWNSIFKGSPFVSDAYRYGRCEARIAGGETANYATFAGFASTNDAIDARWGLVQAVAGGYLIKGLIIFGYETAVDFRDSNKTLIIQNTNKVTSNFNAFEVRQPASKVYLTSITISSLSTVSRGRWITTDDADVDITSCVFTDMGTFTFGSNSTIISSIFRRCDLITQNGATFTSCVFDSSNDSAKAILADDPSHITNCDFISDGTGHGMEISASGTFSFTGHTFTGFGVSGSADAAVYNNSGGHVTIQLTTGDTPTIRDGASATTSVESSATVELTGLVSGSEVRAYVGTDPATASELSGIESGDASYSFGQSVAGQAGYVIVHKTDYKAWKLDLTYSASNQSIPVQQIFDRQYENL